MLANTGNDAVYLTGSHPLAAPYHCQFSQANPDVSWAAEHHCTTDLCNSANLCRSENLDPTCGEKLIRTDCQYICELVLCTTTTTGDFPYQTQKPGTMRILPPENPNRPYP